MASDYRVRIVLEGQDNASDDIRKVNTELKQMDNGAREAGGGFGALGTAVTALVGVWATLQIGQKINELRELGAQSEFASTRFAALSGGAQAAQRNLDAMRTAAGGVVDNLTLMNSANSLMQMGLARSSEDLAKLTQIATVLKKPTDSVADSFQNLAAMLANQSFLRLDQLGLNADRVRESFNKLKDAGMDQTVAFTQAVIREADTAIGRLGEAASASVTQVGRMEAGMRNLMTRAGEGVAALGEDVAGAINPVLDQIEATITRQEEIISRMQELATQGGQTTMGTMQAIQHLGLVSDDVIKQALERFEGVRAQPIAGDPRARTITAVLGEAYDPGNLRHQAIYQLLTDYYDLEQAATDAADAVRISDDTIMTSEWAAAQEARFPGYVSDLRNNPELDRFQAQQASMRRAQQQAYIDRSLSNLYGGVTPSFTRLENQRIGQQRTIESYQPGGYGYGLETLRQMSQREYMSQQADRAAESLGRAAGHATVIPTAMERAAAAAARIPATLTEWLAGGKPGGMQGDFLSAVAAQMAPEDREGFLRNTGMINWRDDLISMIAGMEPGQAAQIAPLMGNWLAGGGQASSIAGAMNAIGFMQKGGGPGASATIGAGGTLWGLAQANNMTVDQIMALNPGVNPYALQIGQAINLGGGGGSGWQRVKTDMPAGAENPLVKAIDEATLATKEQLAPALDEALTAPRNMEITLDFIAETAGITGPFRELVVQIVQEAMQNSGGKLTPGNNRSGKSAGPAKRQP